MTSKPRVSVVIPVYNGEAFIGTAIESALAQPEVDEILVGDDGSTDATQEIVAAFGNPVTLLSLDHTGNPSVVRNAGIEASSNPLVAFLDADDAWLSGKIARQVDVLEGCPALAFVCTNAWRQTAKGQTKGMSALLPPEIAPQEDPFDELIVDNFVITSSVLCRRDLLVSAGMFPVDEHLPAIEDYDCWLRVASAGEVRYLPEPWLVYRDWGPSYRGEWSAIDTAKGLLHVLERLEAWAPGTEMAHADAFRRRRLSLYSQIADVAAPIGAGPVARSAAARAVRLAPGSAAAWKRLARSLMVVGYEAHGGATSERRRSD